MAGVCLLLGVIVGISTAVFLKALGLGITAACLYHGYWLLLPIALPASALIVKVFATDAEGYGTEKIIEAVHRRACILNLAVVPVKLVATVITIAFGGSAGKEGSAAQFGAALSSDSQGCCAARKDGRGATEEASVIKTPDGPSSLFCSTG